MSNILQDEAGVGVILSEPQTETAALERVGPSRILIADDENHIRLAMRSCLEADGYEVEEACDGLEAIHAIIHGSPDLLLLDLAMPNLDGLNLLQELATTYQDLMPRVVILTAWGSIIVAEKAEKLGAAAFLEKPLVPSVLRSVVRRVLREERPFKQNRRRSTRERSLYDDDYDVPPHTYLG